MENCKTYNFIENRKNIGVLTPKFAKYIVCVIQTRLNIFAHRFSSRLRESQSLSYERKEVLERLRKIYIYIYINSKNTLFCV